MSTHEVSMVAAQEWARANAPGRCDPVEFGNKVAQVYCACQMTQRHAGDEKTMAAALASLSVRPEVLQLLGQLSSLRFPMSLDSSQIAPADA